MNILKLTGALVLGAAAVLFFLQNQALLADHVPVVLRLPLVEIRPMPPLGPSIGVMLAIAFAAGFGMAYLLGLMRRFKSALTIRKLKKELAATTPTANAGIVQANSTDSTSGPGSAVGLETSSSE